MNILDEFLKDDIVSDGLNVKEEVVLKVDSQESPIENVCTNSDFNINFLDIDEESIKRIDDTSGEISQKVLNFCKSNKVSNVPFEALELLDQIESVQDFDIKIIDGKKICSYNKGLLDSVRIENLVLKIKEQLEKGKVVNIDLLVDSTLNGKVYRNLALCSYEVNYISSKFRLFKPTLLTSTNPSSIVLKIGG